MTKITIIALAIILGILFLLFLFFNPKSSDQDSSELQVASVIPIDKSTDFLNNWTLIVQFNRPLSAPERSTVELKLDPPTQGIKNWSLTGTNFEFKPEPPLITNQNYQAEIVYEGKSFKWSFTTAAEPGLSEEEQRRIQTAGDKDFADYFAQLERDYPWMNKLPLQSDEYFVYFDSDKKGIIGKLYPKKSSSLSVENQVNSMKTEITKSLQELDIDLNKNPVEWVIEPK